jgi:hypothetical protein
VDHVSEGIDISASSSNVVISRCDAYAGVTGIHISGHDVLVDGCRLHDMNREANSGYDCDNDPATSGDHGGQAIAADSTTGPIEIRNNVAWNNRAQDPCYGMDGAFVEIYRSQNLNVHENRSRDGVVTFEAAGDTSGVKLWRNRVQNEAFLVAHQANNMIVANNTIWNIADVGVLVSISGPDQFGTGSTAGLVFVNNILASTNGMLRLGASWDRTAAVSHNDYYSISDGWFGKIGDLDFGDFSSYRTATGKEKASLAANPLLVDPVNANFRLRRGSPDIDRGIPVHGLGDRFGGAAPDIGAVDSRATP